MIHLCDKTDPWFNDHTRVVEQRYKQLGGEILVIARESDNRSPLSSTELSQVVNFIAKKAKSN